MKRLKYTGIALALLSMLATANLQALTQWDIDNGQIEPHEGHTEFEGEYDEGYHTQESQQRQTQNTHPHLPDPRTMEHPDTGPLPDPGE